VFHAAADQRNISSGFSQRARNSPSDPRAATSNKRDTAVENFFTKYAHSISIDHRRRRATPVTLRRSNKQRRLENTKLDD
jgi:hypothetical protein